MTDPTDSEARELAQEVIGRVAVGIEWGATVESDVRAVTDMLAQALRKSESRGLRGAFEIHVKYPPAEAERVMLEAIEELERGRT